MLRGSFKDQISPMDSHKQTLVLIKQYISTALVFWRNRLFKVIFHQRTFIKEIGNLQQLQNIQIVNCSLSSLPDSFSKLLNLKTLHIFETKLQQLPEYIGAFTHLKELAVRSSHLNKLPISITKLDNLQTLILKANKITQFPVGIEKCHRLTSIYAQNNLIKNIPRELQQLKLIKVGELYLEGNPIQNIQCLAYVGERGSINTKELANKLVKDSNSQKMSQIS